MAGIADFRLGSDRYLDLEQERAKALRLARIAERVDLEGLARAYYAMTPDADPARCRGFLRHILGAEARGEALAGLLPTTGRIVEVGCGTGGLLAAARRSGLTIEGVDIASRWLVVARRRLDDRGLSAPLLAASAERLPYPDASVDAIVADSVLEHLDDPMAALSEWARVLRRGGSLLVWSPNRYSIGVDPHVRLRGVGFLPRRWLPAYVRWRRGEVWPPPCLSPGEARAMARASGFEAVEVEAPQVAGGWSRGMSARHRRAASIYEGIRKFPGARSILRDLGPLWQLRAIRGPGPERGEG